MSEVLSKNSSEIEQLASSLLATLDESVFFSELSKFLGKDLKVDQILAYKVLEDGGSQLVAKNGKAIRDGEILAKGEGIGGQVIRTKRSYFCNNTERDPLLAKSKEAGVISELCIPVAHEGFVIATLHFQGIKNQRDFSRSDISLVSGILEQIERPISNMKMYLSAKILNETLLKKIKEKEKELEERKLGLKVSGSFQIEEKEIIGKSAEIEEIKRLADKVSNSDVNILIEGPSGSGKELISRRIHCRSQRSKGSFIVVDCAALTPERLDEELFGTEQGDFLTGLKSRAGAIENADGGTLCLDGIDKIGITLQAKILNFIKDSLLFRIGGKTPIRSNVRIVGLTNKDIQDEVSKGHIREDFFYSINTMSLSIPGLRERVEDIEHLANHFLNLGKSTEEQKSLSPGALKSLQEYSWPGNIRELQNVIERAYILSEGRIVEKTHLADCVNQNEQIASDIQEDVQIDFTEMTLEELEKLHICKTLDHLSGNKTKTAKMLGITVKTLYNKLHSYGMIAAKE